ncbi:hypothetical protein IE81DRAFT_320654 [Ceraceosorus guamensis]|uniref:Plastocyanin-like domain-containing protein n=1 Tax=Ceraceosorus guamensis TaxID=1522189 RepID=A0A316W5C5_9BASI|nr:hypothetical protein IE81DRAFT_320654 [Ceraceosorus guamensis]PWN45057.1 hypothetical protein IE81DRAFT_320654 [Ceraceosorus guamensis]
MRTLRQGYVPQLLGTGAGFFSYDQPSLDLQQDFPNPMRRDVWTVPGFSWTVIRLTLDLPGLWTL